jgi:DNA gyrase/topoisomerase IV subunit B
MSFVNSIATTKGGRHVDYVTELVVKGIIETIKKKNKTGINIKPFQVIQLDLNMCGVLDPEIFCVPYILK